MVKAVQQISTLDSRTSDICVAYSGLTWDLNGEPIDHEKAFNGGPPHHPRCRSRLNAVTKSFRELGIDRDELPPGKRASLNGEVPADITFDAFLKRKSQAFQNELLGPGKAELWREGRISLTDLVDQTGRPLTLNELRQRFS